MLYMMYIISIVISIILGMLLYRYFKPIKCFFDKIFGVLEETIVCISEEKKEDVVEETVKKSTRRKKQ